ncbi:hypothetical protein DPQ33_05785 [Oceanidesulfovibrio indonesiensis]|uniref:SGNH/GDSL hydrolase family protein n=2 Tax=Oceanidesulfovibrio indonesiensis TaxID=54767 RepID=A0A7M3MGT5_9BACT|nr:hypothetical protein DPQ33_05785 [Oceanidesulfovibrio indonesiensis]
MVEGVARLAYGYMDKTWGLAVPPQVGMLDDELGWKLRPGVIAESKRTGVKVVYRINSKGLRDAEATYEKPPGVYRIVMLGDSRTFGFGVREEQHFPKLLQGYLPGVEVINMGVDGFGVDQNLLFLRHEGFKYEPDLVISYVPHFKDERHMHDRRWNMGKPMFEVAEDGALVLTNSPVANNDAWYVAIRRVDRFLSVSRAYAIFRDMGMMITLALKGGGAPHAHDTEALRDNGLGSVAGLFGPSAAYAESHGQSSGRQGYTEQEVLDRAVAIIEQKSKEAREHGAEYICMTQLYGLIEACEEKGINVLDVRSVLSNALFKLPDGLGHINEAGQGALAWEMTRQLVNSGIIPLEPPSEEDLKRSGGV